MNKKKVIEQIEMVGFLLGCLIGLLTLMLLCAEPTTWDEDGLSEYEQFWNKGNSGWYVSDNSCRIRFF